MRLNPFRKKTAEEYQRESQQREAELKRLRQQEEQRQRAMEAKRQAEQKRQQVRQLRSRNTASGKFGSALKKGAQGVGQAAMQGANYLESATRPTEQQPQRGTQKRRAPRKKKAAPKQKKQPDLGLGGGGSSSGLGVDDLLGSGTNKKKGKKKQNDEIGFL